MNKLVKTKKVTPVALKIFMLVVGPSVTDPYVFGPPEFAFGPVIYLYGFGSFHQQAKKLRNEL